MENLVELIFSGRNMHVKSSHVVVETIPIGHNTRQLVCETETVGPEDNPVWITTAKLTYHPDSNQPIFLKIHINSNPVEEFETTLAQIAQRKEATLVNLRHGTFIIQCDPIILLAEKYTLNIKGIKLKAMDFTGTSDPYLVFYRKTTHGWHRVYRSQTKYFTLNPDWKMKIKAQELSNGDVLSLVKIDCFDWDSGSTDDYIGSNEITLQNLTTSGFRFPLYQSESDRSHNKDSGIIEISKVKLSHGFTFEEYLKGGIDLDFTFAIDFTSRNYDDYCRAISDVVSVFKPYCSPRRHVNLYGFSGIPEGKFELRNCFNLNLDERPGVESIDSILSTYQSSFERVAQNDITIFHEVIDRTILSIPKDANLFSILVIFTDGVIHDLKDTICSIVEGSKKPFSLVIIGIGDRDFTDMDILDCDNGKLTSSDGRQAEADIVQFVPYSKYQETKKLSESILNELPDQLVKYMKKNGISAKSPN